MSTRITALLCGSLGAAVWLLAAQTTPQRINRAHPASPAKPAPRVSLEESKRASTPTLGHLETRDRRITVTLGAKGPLYTIQDKQGRTLHEHLTLEQLRAKAPVVHDLVTTGYARTTDAGAVRLDATLRQPAVRASGSR